MSEELTSIFSAYPKTKKQTTFTSTNPEEFSNLLRNNQFLRVLNSTPPKLCDLRTTKPLILYHGSDMEVQTPTYDFANRCGDFGLGFYCTLDLQQAKDWANHRARYSRRKAVVNVYKYVRDINMSHLFFSEYSDAWVKFILQSRNGIPHSYSIVDGPVADHTFDFIQSLDPDITVTQKLIDSLSWGPKKYKHQICFCSKESLHTLQFKEVYYV